MTRHRVLVVDNDGAACQAIRSCLDSRGGELILDEVPSGEDALLEFARSSVDLLITNMDLPGMSGLELIAWSSQLNPESGAILMAGSKEETVLGQANDLGVVAFLLKPIECEPLLGAVDRALEQILSGKVIPSTRQAITVQLVRMLARARRVLNAEGAFIFDSSGAVLVSEGSLGRLDVGAVRTSLAMATGSGMEVSSWLGSENPWSFQFADGGDQSCFLASIGAHHGLAIYYRGRKTAGRLEAAVRYCQSAVKSMLPLISKLEALASVERMGSSKAPKPGEIDGLAGRLEQAAELGSKQDIEEFWDRAAVQMQSDKNPPDHLISYDEARERGFLSEEAKEDLDQE